MSVHTLIGEKTGYFSQDEVIGDKGSFGSLSGSLGFDNYLTYLPADYLRMVLVLVLVLVLILVSATRYLTSRLLLILELLPYVYY